MLRNEVKNEKELKGLDFEFLENLVFDLMDEYWGKGYASLNYQRKDEHLWTLEVLEEDFYTSGENKKECLIDLYQFLIEKIFEDELEEERRAEEDEERISFERWYNRNNGVAYGRY